MHASLFTDQKTKQADKSNFLFEKNVVGKFGAKKEERRRTCLLSVQCKRISATKAVFFG